MPFSTQKLNTIVNDIKESVNNIEKQAAVVEGLFQREDRKEATIEREAQTKERERQDKFREEQRERLRCMSYVCLFFLRHVLIIVNQMNAW